jgi:hypothetical protein
MAKLIHYPHFQLLPKQRLAIVKFKKRWVEVLQCCVPSEDLFSEDSFSNEVSKNYVFSFGLTRELICNFWVQYYMSCVYV